MPNTINFTQLSYSDFLEGFNFLMHHQTMDPKSLSFSKTTHRWSSLVLTKNQNGITELQQFMNATQRFAYSQSDLEEEKRQKNTIRTHFELFLNLEPNELIKETSFNTDRRPLQMEKEPQRNPNIPALTKNSKGQYISDEDTHAHEHGNEARRIGASTQIERLMGFANRMMSKLGIHLFESTRYQELNYINSTLYADDQVSSSDEQKPSYYWIGHASNLIVIPTPADSKGLSRPLHVLTDPVEGALFPGLYPRQTKEGKLIKGHGENRLPRVDVVVISHNHRDHVDEITLSRLVDQQPKMIVPEGDGPFFKKLGFLNIEELNWGESAKIKQGNENVLTITSVPARHWSGRGLHDAHKSAFAGYVLQSPSMPKHDIYFAGDTAELGKETAQAIYGNFDIGLAIQPGGPDENRRDMESTHQSSADGITAHFRNLLAHYKKLTPKARDVMEDGTMKNEFSTQASYLKTIYDHTATFKLGNLRLRDTYYSYNRVLAVFRKNLDEKQAEHFLASHEFNAYKEIKSICSELKFNDEGLSPEEIANIIERNIIVPKIGQRLDIIPQATTLTNHTPQPSVFDDSRLIINHRALETCEKLAMEWLEQQSTQPHQPTPQLMDDLIHALLKSYHDVWHAKLTRTYLRELKEALNSGKNVSEQLTQLQAHLPYKNRHGHLQNIIHYAEWLNQSVKTPVDLQDYITRLHVRQLVDKEIHIAGSVFILENRSNKTRRFEELANKLEKASSLKEYGEIFEAWKKENLDSLKTPRSNLFKKAKTQSETAIEKIEEKLKNPRA